MNKIEKVILDSVKKMDGFVLGFGNIEEKIIDSIYKNSSINEFTLLSGNNVTKAGSNTGNKTKLKKVSPKKVKNKFKKKNVNYIIASYDDLDKYYRRFISDSLYLVNKGIYVFVKSQYIDIDVLKHRYERYNQACEVIECKDGVVLHIKKQNYKKNILRDKIYLVWDLIVDIFNFIGDIFAL